MGAETNSPTLSEMEDANPTHDIRTGSKLISGTIFEPDLKTPGSTLVFQDASSITNNLTAPLIGEQRVRLNEKVRIDSQTRRVAINGRTVILSEKEFKLFSVLDLRRNQVVPNSVIYESVWDGRQTPGKLNNLFHRLRRKLEPDPSAPQYIVNHWGEGYMFVLPDEQDLEPTIVGSVTKFPRVRQAQTAWMEKPVDLSPTEYKLLGALSRNPGIISTHEYLIYEVWGSRFKDDTKSLRVYIHYLRQKIEKDSHHPTIIVTCRGVGFFFLPDYQDGQQTVDK